MFVPTFGLLALSLIPVPAGETPLLLQSPVSLHVPGRPLVAPAARTPRFTLHSLHFGFQTPHILVLLSSSLPGVPGPPTVRIPHHQIAVTPLYYPLLLQCYTPLHLGVQGILLVVTPRRAGIDKAMALH